MESTSALAPDLDPIAIGWIADLVDELEAALASRKPHEDDQPFHDERERLLLTLPRLRDAINGWIRLLEAQVSGKDVTDSVWEAVRELTHNLPAAPESWEPGVAVIPRVDRNTVAGQVLFARISRAFQSDPFRDAVSALGNADAAEVAKVAEIARANADRATRSIDACLRVLANEPA